MITRIFPGERRDIVGRCYVSMHPPPFGDNATSPLAYYGDLYTSRFPGSYFSGRQTYVVERNTMSDEVVSRVRAVFGVAQQAAAVLVSWGVRRARLEVALRILWHSLVDAYAALDVVHGVRLPGVRSAQVFDAVRLALPCPDVLVGAPPVGCGCAELAAYAEDVMAVSAFDVRQHVELYFDYCTCYDSGPCCCIHRDALSAAAQMRERRSALRALAADARAWAQCHRAECGCAVGNG